MPLFNSVVRSRFTPVHMHRLMFGPILAPLTRLCVIGSDGHEMSVPARRQRSGETEPLTKATSGFPAVSLHNALRPAKRGITAL